MIFHRYPLLMLLLLSFCSGAQQAPTAKTDASSRSEAEKAGFTPEMIDQVNKLANIQKNWGEKMNTPGTEFSLKEVRRIKIEDGTLVKYELYTKNLPRDQQYELSMYRIDQNLETEEKPKILSASGQVMDGADDPHCLLLMAAKGEPYRFALLSKDGQFKAFASVVPFPIKAEDKSCSLEAIRLLPDAEEVLLRGTGFAPGTPVHIDIDSEGEKHGGEVTSDEKGNYTSVLMPYKKDVAKGEVQVKASSPACKPSLKFTWGKGTYQVE